METRLTPELLDRHLKTQEWPANRQQLHDSLVAQGIESAMLGVLDNMPEYEFTNKNEFYKELERYQRKQEEGEQE